MASCQIHKRPRTRCRLCADNAEGGANMPVKDDAVGHQSASFLVDTGIENLGCLVCRDEALLIMNCRTRMAAALGSGAAKVHTAASHRRSRGKYRVRGRSIAACGRGNFPPLPVWVSVRPAKFDRA